MDRFLYGHSCGANATELVSDCLSQIGDIPEAANLGFVYATDELVNDLAKIHSTLKRETGIGHWIGTIGMAISATGQEYYDQPALVVMVCNFPERSFISIPSQTSGIESFIAAHHSWYKHGLVHFGILHGDPASPATPALMERLAAEIPGAFLVGGLTSSEGENLQVADRVTSGGISGVLFSNDVRVATGHTQGCSPLATKHTITRCERNILIELDGQPAFDIFKQDIGEVLAKDLNRISGYIFAGLPIPGSDTADYMVRNLLGIDPEQKLIAIGEHLIQGNEIVFCRRDGNAAREDMLRMLVDIQNRVSSTPKGAIYFSCLGRGRYQFGENSEELKLIQAKLGDMPLVGFFANGEIFHNRIYGYTGVLTVFC